MLSGGPELSTQQLRDLLRKRLPDYMNPAFMEVKDALSLTSSGKVDRRALAERRLPLSTEARSAPPVTSLEKASGHLVFRARCRSRRPGR
jgi:acyl-CoA synthetase (AMP-forming)/AMP-acid ligase II